MQADSVSATSYKCDGCGREVPSGNRAIHSLRCSHSVNIPCRIGEAEEKVAAASPRVSHPVSVSDSAPPSEDLGLDDFDISQNAVQQQTQRSGGPSGLDEEEKLAEVRNH